ncbi:hypothetical protein [Leptolyngbya sp. FACHB-261]|nr:hypothetical protein [Leptolyngbya sp. FACHB-261]
MKIPGSNNLSPITIARSLLPTRHLAPLRELLLDNPLHESHPDH